MYRYKIPVKNRNKKNPTWHKLHRMLF
jgi:hypothetical protein